MADDGPPWGLTLIPPGGGRHVVRFNGEDTVLTVGEAETRGAYAARLNAAPPGFTAVPLHIHRDAEEAFLVLDPDRPCRRTHRGSSGRRLRPDPARTRARHRQPGHHTGALVDADLSGGAGRVGGGRARPHRRVHRLTRSRAARGDTPPIRTRDRRATAVVGPPAQPLLRAPAAVRNGPRTGGRRARHVRWCRSCRRSTSGGPGRCRRTAQPRPDRVRGESLRHQLGDPALAVGGP